MKLSSRILSIAYILLEEKSVFTSEELAKKLGVSLRTIKNDINMYKDYLKGYGLEITSKRGVGHCIEIIDAEKFQAFYTQVSYQYSNEKEIPNDFEERLQYIIRTLIATELPVSLDDLAEELFVVKRSLSREMKQARQILQRYHIAIETQGGCGIVAKGSEFSKRLCQVDYYMHYYHKAQPYFRAKRFRELFEIPMELRLQTRQIFLEEMRKSSVVIKDFYSQKFPIFLLLAYRRCADGHGIELSPNHISYYRDFYEYSIITDITKRTNAYFEHPLPEEEKVFLTIMLLYFEDIHPAADYTRYGVFCKNAQSYMMAIIGQLQVQYEISFLNEEQLQDDLIRVLIPISIAIKFYIYERMSWGRHRRFSIPMNNPLALELACASCDILYAITGVQLCSDAIYQLAFTFVNAISRQFLTCKKRKLLLMGASGYDSIQLAKERIEAYYSQYIECIDIKENYQLRTDRKLLEYDYIVITDKDMDMYYAGSGGTDAEDIFSSDTSCKSIPAICISDAMESNNYDILYKYLVLDGLPLEQLLPTLRSKDVSSKLSFATKDEVFKFFAYRDREDVAASKRIAAMMRHREDIMSFEGENGVAVIFMLGSAASQKKLEMISLLEPILWKKHEISHVVYFEFCSVITPLELRAIETAAKRALKSSTFVEDKIKEVLHRNL